MHDSPNGIFLAFEGIDGCGKRKVSRIVSDTLKANGHKVTFVPKICPPVSSGYGTFHLTRLKELLWQYEPLDPLMDLGDSHWLHLIVSWFHAIDYCSIQPALREGNIVVADSWYYKYLARFNLKSTIPSNISRQNFCEIRKPDHVIHIDVDPVDAEWRLDSPTPSERGMFDSESDRDAPNFVEYQSKIRREILRLRTDSWSVVEAKDSQSVSSVVEKSMRIVEPLLSGEQPRQIRI